MQESVNAKVNTSRDLYFIVLIILSNYSNYVVYNSTYPGKSTNINVFYKFYRKLSNSCKYFSANILYVYNIEPFGPYFLIS